MLPIRLRASYNGYYVSFPSLRRGFDSLRPHPLITKAMTSGTKPQPIVFFVNLDRSTDRLSKFLKLNGCFAADLRRVSAVEGKNVQRPPVDNEGYALRNSVATPRAGEIGCYLSHLKAYEALLATDHEWAIIMEDDCSFSEGAIEAIEAIAAKDDWDVVKLFHFHRGTPINVRRLTAQYSLCVQLTRTTSSACYMIRRKAALRYLESLKEIREPIDHAIDRPWIDNLRIRATRPMAAAVGADALTSTIGYAERRTPQPLLKRALVKSYKGWQEIRRFLCAVKHILSEKLV